MNSYLLSVMLYASLSIIVLWILFTVTFIIAQKIKLWRILDITWGMSFITVVFLGWAIFLKFQITNHIVPILLVILWGIRLTTHIFLRSRKSKAEDPRFESFKKRKGPHKELIAYFQSFLFQALIAWIMCIPFYFYIPIDNLILQKPINTSILIISSLFAICALLIEATADFQLSKFKEPGKLLQKGVWKYSRHPNYFGEISFWWAIWFMTRVIHTHIHSSFDEIGLTTIVISGLLALLSPLAITIIIGKITGPMLEKIMEKYPEWEEYKKNTPYIFPKIF